MQVTCCPHQLRSELRIKIKFGINSTAKKLRIDNFVFLLRIWTLSLSFSHIYKISIHRYVCVGENVSFPSTPHIHFTFRFSLSMDFRERKHSLSVPIGLSLYRKVFPLTSLPFAVNNSFLRKKKSPD
mgnify:CR=1 FL=1